MYVDYKADQALGRKNARLRDQFGRLWGTTIEKSTGDPCGEVAPFGGWADPLNTPNVYIVVPKFKDGEPMPGRVEVDFDAWVADVEINTKHWHEAIELMGKTKFPYATSEERDGWPTNPHLTSEAGPLPSPDIVTLRKAKAGDPELLGNPVPGEDEPVKMTWKRFMSSQQGQGHSTSRIAQDWKDYKAGLLAV